MRILNWNISHGGGSRIPAICKHIEDVDPDLLALTEFQTRNESSLRAELQQIGYPFIVTSSPMARQNGLLVASKWQIDRAASQLEPDTDRERWLAVRLDELNLDILVLHIPGAPDNKFEDGYGISGARRKELFWERAIGYATEHREHRAIVMGDFNTGFRIDAEGAMFKKSHYMQYLTDTGFVDTWRHLHPNDREYTWYSRRKDKATGISEDLNGFRLDYIFVSPALKSTIVDVSMLQGPRKSGTSDHASVVADVDLSADGTYPDHYRPEKRSTTVGYDVARHDVPDATPGQARMSIVKSGNSLGRLRARLNLAPGDLPDMACGVNGQAFVQILRPTYVTAEWASGVLTEVRIWGPRVLQDGSLGKRELDHVWKQPAGAGGVSYDDIPTSVAAQLRSYIATSGGSSA